MPLPSDDVSVLQDALRVFMSESETESIVSNLSNHASLHKLSELTDSIIAVKKKARLVELRLKHRRAGHVGITVEQRQQSEVSNQGAPATGRGAFRFGTQGRGVHSRSINSGSGASCQPPPPPPAESSSEFVVPLPVLNKSDLPTIRSPLAKHKPGGRVRLRYAWYHAATLRIHTHTLLYILPMPNQQVFTPMTKFNFSLRCTG